MGDVNNDGYGDILVGSPQSGTTSQGHAYLVFGGLDLPSSMDLESELTGSNGVVFKGALTGESWTSFYGQNAPCSRSYRVAEYTKQKVVEPV